MYEVTAVLSGRLVDNQRHLSRLARSLDALNIPLPMPTTDIEEIQRELVSRNDVDEGLLYIQVTRGAAERDFAIANGLTPTMIAFTQTYPLIDSPLAARGARVMTVPETRWAHRDIKTTQLLPASLAKQRALNDGYDDAWFVEEGFVTEGTSSNAYIVTRGRTIVTRMLGQEILPGITRQAVLEIADAHAFDIDERPFSVTEAQNAAEAFFSSATALITPVIAIDGHPVGSGTPGSVTGTIRAHYVQRALRLHH